MKTLKITSLKAIFFFEIEMLSDEFHFGGIVGMTFQS
jgi:hypothetical protein